MSSRPEPMPIGGTGAPLWPEVIRRYAHLPDFAAAAWERHQFGMEKYGQPLRAGNGRNAVVDALQEALDLVVYLEQMAVEARSDSDEEPIRRKQAEVVALVDWLLNF